MAIKPLEPTKQQVETLQAYVTDPREKEILMRLTAELTTGARHNDDDLNRYTAMVNTYGADAEAAARKKVVEAEAAKRKAEGAPVVTPQGPGIKAPEPSSPLHRDDKDDKDKERNRR